MAKRGFLLSFAIVFVLSLVSLYVVSFVSWKSGLVLADGMLVDKKHLVKKYEDPSRKLIADSFGFGARKSQVKEKPVLKSRLPMTLSASFAALQGVPYAIVKVQGGSRLVRLGDDITPGVTLVEVKEKEVYILNKGITERLSLGFASPFVVDGKAASHQALADNAFPAAGGPIIDGAVELEQRLQRLREAMK